MFIVKGAVIGLLIALYIFETVVALLNQKHSRRPIAKRLKDIFDQERYQKWLAYSLEMRRFALFRKGFDLAVLLVLLTAVFWRWEQLSLSWPGGPILHSLYFLGLYWAITFLLGIPFRVYQVFSIEERHGFNRTDVKTFIRDQLVGAALSLILGGALLAGVHALYLKFSANLWSFIFLSWLGLSAVLLFIFAFLNKFLLRVFNKFTPLPEGSLRTRIENLASTLGFNVKAILVMDASRRTSKLNAAFTGIGKAKEVILFDTLLEKMTEDQILAVLAHELGHAIHKDTLRMAIGQIIMMILYVGGVGLILQSPALFTAFAFSGVHFGFAVVLFAGAALPLLDLLLSVPLNWLLRQAEYRADRFSALHTDSKWLISALKVLARENLSNLNPHPATVLLNYSHPPLNQRIAALERA